VALALLPFAIDRETLIETALVLLAIAALVVGFGAVVLFRRERRRPGARSADPPD